MNKINLSIAFFLILLFLSSCGSIGKGLGGSKKKGSDEFLVKKKAPLVLPPSFEELPEPGNKIDKSIVQTREEVSNIEKIINENSSVSSVKEDKVLKNSVEESIIKKINDKKIKEVNLEQVIKIKEETPKKKKFFQRLKEKLSKH
tara:strand:- start:68 stop:502 length:435 start_codon:yes stop_codon:yes gene_type:complete